MSELTWLKWFMQVSEGIVEGQGCADIAAADESVPFEVCRHCDPDGTLNWILCFLNVRWFSKYN